MSSFLVQVLRFTASNTQTRPAHDFFYEYPNVGLGTDVDAVPYRPDDEPNPIYSGTYDPAPDHHDDDG